MALASALGALAACALPAVALAGAPRATSVSVEVIGSAVVVTGYANDEGSETTVHVNYGPIGGLWCTSGAREGTALETRPQALGEAEAAGAQVRVDVNGLQGETWYCAELVAHNEDGTAYGGQIDFKSPPPGSLKTESEELPLPVQHINPYERENAGGAEYGAVMGHLMVEEHEREQSRIASERKAVEAREREAREASERALAAARCLVPHLKGRSLAGAREALARSHCKLGKVRRASHHGRLRVVGQTIPAGRELSAGTAVGVRLGARAQ